MIWPRRSISFGRSARVSATSPVMLVSMTCSTVCQSASCRGSIGGARPALLSSRSISPQGGESCRQVVERFKVAHVEFERQEAIAQLVGQFPQALRAPTGADHLPAAGCEALRRGLAEARRGAGDQDGLRHGFSESCSRIQALAVGQSSIRAWACSAVGTAGSDRGSAIMCSRQTFGRMLGDRRMVDRQDRRRRRRRRPPLDQRLARASPCRHCCRSLHGGCRGSRAGRRASGCASSPRLVRMTMSATSPIRPKRLDRAGDQGLAMHLAAEEASSSGHASVERQRLARLDDRSSPRRSRPRLEREVGCRAPRPATRRSARPCAAAPRRSR